MALNDLQLRITASGLFVDTSVMPRASGAVPDFVEDFSSYADTTALVGTPPAGMAAGQHTGPFGGAFTQFYRESGGVYTLENDGVNINGLALTKSLRVGFPDSNGWTDDSRVVNGVADRLDNYTMRPNLQPGGAAWSTRRRVWLEMYTKFSPTWKTQYPAGWGSSGPPDHKTWLLNTLPDATGRFEIKVGSGLFGDGRAAIKCGDPQSGEGGLPNLLVASPPDERMVAENVWNNAWHRWRVQIDLGTSGVANGIFRVWLDGSLIHERTGVLFDPAITGFQPMQMGANRNHGQDGAMWFAWGLIRTFNTNPGWL